MKRKYDAFSLLEVLIVLIILSVLILLAGPKFLDYIGQAKHTQIINDEKLIHKLIIEKQANSLIDDNVFEVIEEKNREYKIKEEFLKDIDTKLDKTEFYYLEYLDKVEYRGRGSDKYVSYQDYLEAKKKYSIVEDSDGSIKVYGFTKSYLNKNKNEYLNIEDMGKLEYKDRKVIRIMNRAFEDEKIYGRFPKLDYLERIGTDAFLRSRFRGNFPCLGSLTDIRNSAFQNSSFTGVFPNLPKLTKLGSYVFESSNFTGDFPNLENITSIGRESFSNSNIEIDSNYYGSWDGKASYSR